SRAPATGSECRCLVGERQPARSAEATEWERRFADDRQCNSTTKAGTTSQRAREALSREPSTLNLVFWAGCGPRQAYKSSESGLAHRGASRFRCRRLVFAGSPDTLVSWWSPVLGGDGPGSRGPPPDRCPLPGSAMSSAASPSRIVSMDQFRGYTV